MKKFLSKQMMIAGMMMLCAMVSFTACSSDDDEGDDGGNGSGNGGSQVEAGWSGNTDNGTSYYKPADAYDEETGITKRCRFEASNGICTKSDARFECNSSQMAEILYDYLINGDDDEDDYAVNNSRVHKLVKAAGRTRADIIYDLTNIIRREGKTVIISMSLNGKKMEDIKTLMDLYTDDSIYGYTYDPDTTKTQYGYYNIAKLPASPVFGTIATGTLNYNCDIAQSAVSYFAYGMNKLEMSAARNESNNMILTQTMTFLTNALAEEFVQENGSGNIRNGNKVTGEYNLGYQVSNEFMEGGARQYIVLFDAIYNEPVGISLLNEF